MPPKKRDKENDSSKSTKLENPSLADQESFLQAFEKPTQIYRYLRTRNMIKPIFLYRNLTYMKHRMSRSHKSRKHFKVDSVLHDVTNRLSKQPLNTYLTLTFYGFYSRRALRLGYNEPVKVETLLVKNCHKKRKEITCPVMSVSFGTCTVEMNPNEDAPPLKAPTISIPTEKFMTPAAGAKSFKLVLNVTTSKVVHDYVPTAKDDYDNVIKKRKVGSSDEDEPVKFTKSITLYSKQKCSLTEGDYEIYLELDEKKNKNDTSLSTWEDCNGLLDQEFQERHKDSFQKMLEGPTLKFRLSFEREKINAEVDWPKPLQARDHSAVEKAEGTVERRLNEHKVVYQFLYNSNSRQQTEASYDMHCPWCSVDCKVLYSLLKHLRLCHPRFNFNYVPVQGGVRIDISVNETYDGSSWNTLGGIMLRGSGPVKRQPCTTIIVCRPKRSSHNLSEFINAEEEAPRPYITGHNRLYHHTTTCLPIYPKEMDLDSEDETDPSWLRQKTQMMIDEFTDVNEGEKELMKMWNLHVMKHGFVGDVQVQLACEMFLQERGKELLSKNLYRNFVVHMCNLFDFGLVSPLTVFKIMQQVQDIIQSDPKLNKILQECWTAQREHWNPAEQAPKQENRAKSCQQSQDSSGPSRRKPAQDEKGKRRRGRRMAQSSKPDLRSKDSSNKKSAVSS